MSYYNTTNLVGAELLEAKESSDSLKEKVQALFLTHQRLTPWQALRLAGFGTITGIRCAITGLTDAGELNKTTDKVPGPYGRPEHIWEKA